MFEKLVPMRDGVKLRTRIWIPPGTGPFPVVLERGYWPGREKHAALFPQAGYAYVGQKARGNLDGGMFFPDAQDGYDCIEWIARQTIYHDAAHPSHIVLPIIPKQAGPE